MNSVNCQLISGPYSDAKRFYTLSMSLICLFVLFLFVCFASFRTIKSEKAGKRNRK